jgi:hypothetical protein
MMQAYMIKITFPADPPAFGSTWTNNRLSVEVVATQATGLYRLNWF